MMQRKAKSRGVPPKYKNVEEIQSKIDEYFKRCEGEQLIDDDGEPRFTEKGYPMYKTPPEVPSIPGLALALGFTSRQSLINYQDKPDFMDTISRAKLIIEKHNSGLLYNHESCRGAMFTLTVNYGWRESRELELGDKTRAAVSVASMTMEDKRKLLASVAADIADTAGEDGGDDGGEAE